jgi:Ca2+-transporting ATPase
MTSWHQLEIEAALTQLEVDERRGLTAAEAGRRLARYGPNDIVERGTKTLLRILWEQLTGIMMAILIIAALVSFFLGETEDAITIVAIVILNAVLGLSQEYRAEQAIAALKQLAVPTVRVRRDGDVQEISARELVPGDLIFLEAGNKVSADARLLESINLQIQEAALTGESEPVEKSPGTLEGEELPLGDRTNMVYMGTLVTYGRGKAVVTGTGMGTELGGIAEMLQTVEREPTPLQRRLDQLGKSLAWLALAIIAIVLVLGRLRGDAWDLLLLTGISMAVAAVPEGLPAVVTITLALGSRRMLARQALIRKLPAVETLGSVTVICSDKTGTLTENRMTVSMLDVAGESLTVDTILREDTPVLDAELDASAPPPQRGMGLMLKAAALCNDAVLQFSRDGSGDMRAIGDPTEGALVVAAAQLGLVKDELEERWPRVSEIAFSSERKRMTTLHRVNPAEAQPSSPWRDAPFVAFSKGAVDNLLETAQTVWVGNETLPLSPEWRERILAANERMAQKGQRVLGVSFRAVDQLPDGEAALGLVEGGHSFVGLVGLLDPPRPEVKEAVATCLQAGIRPVMITGDHPLTARHIAEEVLISAGGASLTGAEIARMSIEELEAVVGEVDVYARVSPEHKLNIVTALQDRGAVVAMTGDGVNDAPALKKADIGVAMGLTGTDVSKEAADMVLLDDNFATIVAAVEEGRVIYDNIRKFIKYILSSNIGELLVMLAGPLLGMPLPLLPLQILWINLVTDGLPGLALAVEPAERGTMSRPPYHPGESVFSRGIGRQIIWLGVLLGLVSLLTGYLEWDLDPNGPWQTMVFTTLTLAQLGNALASRSSRESLFRLGLLTNRAMLGAVLLTFLLQLAVVYLPPLQRIFETMPLNPGQLALALLLSTIVFWASEIEKWILRRRE